MKTIESRLPGHPAAFARACVREGRFVARQAILDAVDSYELVEAYPDDKYLPSYLFLARPLGDAIHVLFAADVWGDNVRVVTAYRPSADEWMDDLKTRRISR